MLPEKDANRKRKNVFVFSRFENNFCVVWWQKMVNIVYSMGFLLSKFILVKRTRVQTLSIAPYNRQISFRNLSVFFCFFAVFLEKHRKNRQLCRKTAENQLFFCKKIQSKKFV